MKLQHSIAPSSALSSSGEPRSLGIWVRYRLSPSGKGFTREPKPRFLFSDPEGLPPPGWAVPGSPEDDRLRAEAQSKLA